MFHGAFLTALAISSPNEPTAIILLVLFVFVLGYTMSAASQQYDE
jgi:FtsH-binding integral membrane protein